MYPNYRQKATFGQDFFSPFRRFSIPNVRYERVPVSASVRHAAEVTLSAAPSRSALRFKGRLSSSPRLGYTRFETSIRADSAQNEVG
jgi:hypothetical protein